MQIHRLPDVVLAPREDAEIAHDLARPLGTLLDTEGHGVEVLERVVDLAGIPLGLHARLLGLGQRHAPIDLEHAAEPAHEVLERGDVGVHESDGIVQLVRHAGDELANGGHLLPLDELHLRGLEFSVGGLQILVGGAELLRADAHLVLEAAGEILDGLEALGAIHRERHVVGHGGEQLQVRLADSARLARGHVEDAEDPRLDAEGDHDERPDAERAGGGQVDRFLRGLDVVDDEREPGARHPGGSVVRIVQPELHGVEGDVPAPTARRPMPAHRLSHGVDEEQMGALVAHPVNQPLERLLVDLLVIERGIDGRREVAQERELLDLGLEIAELPLELLVRVQDLLGLDVEQPPRLESTAPLEQGRARGGPRQGREQRKGSCLRPPQAVLETEHQPHGDGGHRAGEDRRPEPPAERQVLPAHLPDARRVALGRARMLDDLRARQPPVGGIPLEADAPVDTAPARHLEAGDGGDAEHGPVPAHVDQIGFGVAVDRQVDRRRALEDRARAAEPHRVRADIGALVVGGLPVHVELAPSPRPGLDVGGPHQLHCQAHQLVGERMRHPVVVGDQPLARLARGPDDRLDPRWPYLLLHEGDERLEEDAVELSGHIPARDSSRGHGLGGRRHASLRAYLRASRIRLNGVSVARRKRLNPASANTARRRASPACAPRPSPTSCEREFGVQIMLDAA